MSDIADPAQDGTEAGDRICWKCGETYGSHLQYCPEDGSQLVELDPTEEGDLLVGTVFDDRFRILNVLGEGGMSRVYHARQVDNERHVALKILKADFLRDEEIRKRFMYEARVIAGLDHEAAVDLYDFGQAPDGSFYMVMELLEGESLAERLRRRFISYDEIFSCAIPTCGVMAEAHRDDVIHRDLKPENIYMAQVDEGMERPKLLDFGIAKHLRMGTMTQSDARWGTPAYMSPEQASGDPVQGTADIYALGVMLYELVAGVLPFRASTAMGFAVKHMHKDVRPLRELPGMGDVVPEELDELICQMVSKEPERRPGSMELVQRRLESVRDSEVMDSRSESTPAESLNRNKIELNPEAEEAGSGGSSVGVDEELKSAHTVFVGDEEEGPDVEGEAVANLHAADGRGSGRATGVGPNAPTPTGASTTQTGSDGEERDTAELGARMGGQRRWVFAGVAMLVGGIAAYGLVWAVWSFGTTRGEAETVPAGPTTSNASGRVVLEPEGDAGRVAEQEPESEVTAAVVGKAARLAAQRAVRARSIAMQAQREVQAMPAAKESSGANGSRRGTDQTKRSGGATGGSDGSKPSDSDASEKAVQEALEATF